MLPAARQTWVVSAVLLNMLGAGMILSFPSALLPGLRAEGSAIQADLDTLSWLASIVGLATFPGFLASAYFMEQWGRKFAQALVIIPGAAGWLVIYLATDVPTLMVGRILGGFTCGASVILGAVVIGEYTSPRLRGMFLNLKTAVVCLGNTLLHIMGHYYSWKTVAICGLIPHVLAFAIVCTWPESPVWTTGKYKFVQSQRTWMWLRGNDSKSKMEYEIMVKAQKKRLSDIQNSPNDKTVVNFIRKFTKKDFIMPLLIIAFADVLKEACGRHIFPAYALEIMENITGDKSQSFYYTLIIDLITTISATFSSVLVRMFKRRCLLFYTGWASVAVLAGICTCLYLSHIEVITNQPWVPVSMFILYFVLTNLGCTVIPLALFGEVFPVAHKGAGSAVTGLLVGVILMTILKVTPTLLDSVKVYGTFAIFGIAMAISLLVLYFVLPETKDRTLQEIEEYFNQGKFSDENVCVEDGNGKRKYAFTIN